MLRMEWSTKSPCIFQHLSTLHSSWIGSRLRLMTRWAEVRTTLRPLQALFPVTTDIPFPKTFQPQCKKILTRLYRVFVHVYVHHFDRIMSIGRIPQIWSQYSNWGDSDPWMSGAEPHVNTCYKHFYYFVTEFDLINEKEFAPLQVQMFDGHLWLTVFRRWLEKSAPIS